MAYHFGITLFLILTVAVDLKTALVGCIIWAVIFVVWVIVFQSMWRDVPFLASLQLTTSEGIAWE